MNSYRRPATFLPAIFGLLNSSSIFKSPAFLAIIYAGMVGTGAI